MISRAIEVDMEPREDCVVVVKSTLATSKAQLIDVRLNTAEEKKKRRIGLQGGYYTIYYQWLCGIS